MRLAVQLLLAVALSACATQEEAVTQDTEQAVRDFIAVRQLEETRSMRTANDDSWHVIDPKFLIYETRDQTYLLEFQRRCYELEEGTVVADERWSRGVVRARFDTLRGCRIAKLYPLTEDEAAELDAIGESPGSRN